MPDRRRRHAALSRLLPAVLLAALAAPAPAQQARQGPPPVDVATPLVETVTDHNIYTGRFEATERVALRARVSGYLDDIRFRDGDIVEKGAELFVIDQRPFEAAVSRAEAALASAEAAAELARIELARATQLAERNVGTEQEVDRTRATLAQAEAEVLIAEAELEQARLDLEFTVIRAPFEGRISETELDRGNLVTGGPQGATVLATIVRVDPIYFVFTASEADYLRYSRLGFDRPSANDGGQIEVAVRLMDEDSFRHRGRLNFVENELNPNSGTITGRAVIEDPEGFIVPGLFGRVRVPASRPYEALLIPDEAVLSDQARKIVMTVDGEGGVSQAVVETGPLHRGLRIIREGIGPDTRVVVAGVQRARPGSTVSPNEVTISGEDG